MHKELKSSSSTRQRYDAEKKASAETRKKLDEARLKIGRLEAPSHHGTLLIIILHYLIK